MGDNDTKIFVDELLTAVTTSTQLIVDDIEAVIVEGVLLAPNEEPVPGDVVLNYNGNRYAYSEARGNLTAYETYITEKTAVKSTRNIAIQAAVDKFKMSVQP